MNLLESKNLKLEFEHKFWIFLTKIKLLSFECDPYTYQNSDFTYASIEQRQTGILKFR